MNNPLNDKDFLKQLDLVKNKKTFVKIYNLNFEEEPREEIVGKVTAGSLNIDGTSAVRRTCSLTMVANEVNINEYLWAINTKIKIFIGVENTINSKYDNIIWFNQGIFILTTFNVSYTASNYTIQINAQDKMCLLNGTIGGVLPASIDFKQMVYSTKSYKPISFGPQYFSNLYYTADEKDIRFVLDQRDEYTDNELYFVRSYDAYFPATYLTEEEFQNDQEDIYIEKETRFELCTLDDWDEELQQPKVTLYEKKVQEGDEQHPIYSKVTYNNDKLLENITTYYKDMSYQVADRFNDFTVYFERDEKGYFKQVILDAETFSKDNKTYYFKDAYELVENKIFNYDTVYYKKEEGSYELIKITTKSYLKDTYFNLHIDRYYLCEEDNFDKNRYYFEKIGDTYTLVDFLSEAEQKYIVGVYYLEQGNDYILAKGEYNPDYTYYELEEYSSKEDIPIKTIIKEAVHTYGQEPYHNIVINDLDDYGLLLKEYRGDTPLYLLIRNGICENICSSDEQICYLVDSKISSDQLQIYQSLFVDESLVLQNRLDNGEITRTEYKQGRKKLFETFKDVVSINPKSDGSPLKISDKDFINYDTYIDEFNIEPSKVFFEVDDTKDIGIYTILKLEYGDAAGYEQKDLTYPEDLISSIGESLTSILDKICDKLQDFEYFYDVDGRFIFQRKKIYFNKSWNNIITDTNDYGVDEFGNKINNSYVENAAYTSEIQYTFEDNDLITSIQNTPKLDNIKNDYSIWGKRKTLEGTEVPIHARYAIDKKPYAYVTFPKTKYNYKEGKDELITKKDSSGLIFLIKEIYINKDFVEEVLMDDFYMAVADLEEDEDITIQDIYNNNDLTKIRFNPSIGTEPVYYQDKYSNKKGSTQYYAGVYYEYRICDWREVIYQMALDYYKHNQENDFLANIIENNTFNYDQYSTEDNTFLQLLAKNAGKLYPSGITGYEQYYVDLYSFWRDIYNPKPEVEIGYTGGYYDNDGNWVEAIEDYSQFNCKYYLPESEYKKYEIKIKEIIEKYQEEIENLEKVIEKYRENSDYAEIEDSIYGYYQQTEIDESTYIPNTYYILENKKYILSEEYLEDTIYYIKIPGLQDQLTEAQNRKADLLRSYYSNNIVVVNDPDYLELQQEYRYLSEDKNNAIKELEQEIVSILEDSFGLY